MKGRFLINSHRLITEIPVFLTHRFLGYGITSFFIAVVFFTPCAVFRAEAQDPKPRPARDSFIDAIERNLQVGRNREALHLLNALRNHNIQTVDEPLFVFLEAQALMSNGFPEEAQHRIELLRTLPNWEDVIDGEKLLAVEVQVLKAVGQPLDALGLVEQDLPELDLIDPPYPVDTTQKYLLYGDLQLACGRFEEGVYTLFDLLLNGSRRFRDDVTQALLAAANQQVLKPEDYERLLKFLPDIPGISLWNEFSKSAFRSGYHEMASTFLLEGLTDHAPKLRLNWEEFLRDQEEGPFLDLVGETVSEILDGTGENKSLDLQILAAQTYRRIGDSERAIELTREIATNRDLSLQLFAARMYGDEGYFDEASEIYEDLETRAPGKFLEAWGSLYVQSGDTDQALKIWSRIPDTHANSVEGYLLWGRLLEEKGFLEESKNAFLAGIEKTRKPIHFAYELLEVSLSLSDVEGALVAYETLRGQTSPGTTKSVWTPGRLLTQLKRTQQAEVFAHKLAEVIGATSTVQAEWRDFAIELATDLALQLNKVEIISNWIHSPSPALVAYWESAPLRKTNHFLNMGSELSFRGEDLLAVQVLDRVDPPLFDLKIDAAEAAARSHESIGQASEAIRYWEIIHRSNRASRMNLREAEMAIARLHLEEYRAGEALKWLNQIDEDKEPRTIMVEVKFLKGLAYSRLHEKRKAIRYLEDVLTLGMKHAAGAVFWLAEWELWQRNHEEAEELYRQVLSMDPGQRLANDSLERLRHLTQLEEEQIPAYSLAAFFEAGGNWSDAEENYRKLASLIESGDLSDWAYYRLGSLLIRTGRHEEGMDQWSLLLERTSSETLKRKIRLEILKIRQSDQAELFEEIVMEDPNSLIGDLARDEMLSAMEEAEVDKSHSPIP